MQSIVCKLFAFRSTFKNIIRFLVTFICLLYVYYVYYVSVTAHFYVYDLPMPTIVYTLKTHIINDIRLFNLVCIITEIANHTILDIFVRFYSK